MNTAATQVQYSRGLLQALGPLIIWLALLFILFLIHTHQRLLEKTRLTFSITLEGKPLLYEEIAQVDGRPFTSGERISLGSHMLRISYPKARLFSTNLFIWYGPHLLGNVDLQRGMGVIRIEAVPTPQFIRLQGPEFTSVVTNSDTLVATVPMDTYRIEANLAHWQEREKVSIRDGETNFVRISPKIGSIALTCNQPDASFELRNSHGQIVEDGSLPRLISELPQGGYTVYGIHHGNHQQTNVWVTTGSTNTIVLPFYYGAVVLESDPPGATILAKDGEKLGTTPMTFAEVRPGSLQFTLQREGFEPVFLSLLVGSGQTNIVHTNLVNRAFRASMKKGQEALDHTNYEDAVTALTQALNETPNDVAAQQLLKVARVGLALHGAEEEARKGNFQAALQQVALALSIDPDLDVAKERKALYERAYEQALDKARKERAVAERKARPQKEFERWMSTTMNSEYFETQVLTAKGRIQDIEGGLVEALTNRSPAFKITSLAHPTAEILKLSATHSMSIAGRRRVDLLVGQTSDDEVTLVFKVFEYTYVESLSIRAMLGGAEDRDLVPIHDPEPRLSNKSLLSRRAEGVRLISERIRAVIGE